MSGRRLFVRGIFRVKRLPAVCLAQFFFLCQKLFYLAGGYLVAFADAAQVEVLYS